MSWRRAGRHAACEAGGRVEPVTIDFQLEALLRLVLAGIAAGILGVEREAADEPAGTRTFAVVGIGSCLFTLAAVQAFDGQADATSRVAAQIVTGIGFLGAGTIIQVRDPVHGLTTAAGILGRRRGRGGVRLGALRARRRDDGAAAVFIAVVGREMPTPKRSVEAAEAHDDDAGRAPEARLGWPAIAATRQRSPREQDAIPSTSGSPTFAPSGAKPAMRAGTRPRRRRPSAPCPGDTRAAMRRGAPGAGPGCVASARGPPSA